MKANLLDERDEKLEVIDGTSWRTLVVAAPNVQNKATVIGKYALNLFCKRQKPIYISIFVLIAVCFLKMQSVGRRGDNEVDARMGAP